MVTTRKGAIYSERSTPVRTTTTSLPPSSPSLVSTARMVLFPFTTLLEKYGLDNIDPDTFWFNSLLSKRFEWGDVVNLFVTFCVVYFHKLFKRVGNSSRNITLQCQGCNGACSAKLYF